MGWFFLVLIILFLIMLTVYDLTQRKRAILRNFPIIGHLRYILESIGPELRQYIVESDTDGKPYDRHHRSQIYQRAKNVGELLLLP